MRFALDQKKHFERIGSTHKREVEMNRTIRAISCTLIMMVLAIAVAELVSGQSNTNTQTPQTSKDTPTLTATLVEAEKKAQQKAATVEVKVTGVKLVDPAKSNEQPKAGEGHIHYQVDDGPIIATPAMKLSFHGLSAGSHKIMVALAGNDHNPLGPQQTLTVTIP